MLRRAPLGMLVGLVLAGCASAVAGPRGPLRSASGVVYAPGTPPVETRFSQTATLYLSMDEEEGALEQAQQGVANDPSNPVHYYLAGVAHARLGDYVESDRMFSEAQRIYPAYELEVEPEREAAWALAFNAGLEAYRQGDEAVAIEEWRRAAVIYDLQPAAHRNLASLLAEQRRYDEAIRTYQEALEGLEKTPATRVLAEDELLRRVEIQVETEERLAQLLLVARRFAEAEPLLKRQLARDSSSVRVRSDLATTLEELDRDEEAAEVYASLLSEETLETTELFNLGVALFRSSRYDEASEAFKLLTERQPDSRDAWFNYANALFAAEAWATLVVVGNRLVELDALNENAQLITARAHLETGDREGALLGLERADSSPVHLTGLRLRSMGSETLVQGRVVGNAEEPGTPVRLRFTFYDENGPLGTNSLSVLAPTTDEGVDFEVFITGRAVAYRYELVPSSPP